MEWTYLRVGREFMLLNLGCVRLGYSGGLS